MAMQNTSTFSDKLQCSHESSLQAWETNAEFWDNYMGNHSNDFHRQVVRPKVNELLDIQTNDYILDIACGNGNYSSYLAAQGVDVVAFDYSPKMIELARKNMPVFVTRLNFVWQMRPMKRVCCH